MTPRSFSHFVEDPDGILIQLDGMIPA